jgi:hypothetical protein
VSFIWRLETENGTPLSTVDSPAHLTQSDAESWLGEQWRELAESGVAQVSLLSEGALVYGPMLLTEA